MRIETQEYVREVFDYDKDGWLIWIKNSMPHVIGKRVYAFKKGNYLFIEHKDIRYSIHRIIFLWHKGYLPKRLDHIDRNPLNNRIENLREADASQNAANSIVRGRSIYKGVHLSKVSKKHKHEHWVVNFKCKPKGIFIMLQCKSEQQAALEYNKLAVKYHKEFAYLNIIQPDAK